MTNCGCITFFSRLLPSVKNTVPFLSAILILVLSSMFSYAQVDGLVLYLPFEEGSGDTTTDLSGNGNHGTLQGPQWTDEGKYGNALEFDGEDDVVLVPDSDSISLEDAITISVWLKPSILGGERAIVTKGVNGEENYELMMHQARFWLTFTFEGGRKDSALGDPGLLEADIWHHAAVTYNSDDSSWIVYWNGELFGIAEQAGTDAGKMIPNRAEPLTIANDPPRVRYFGGVLDDLAIFNRALSQEEIQVVMNTPNLTPVSPLGNLATSWGAIKRRKETK